MKKLIQRNWLFFIIFLLMGIVFIRRYSYLQASIVSRPDSWIEFHAGDDILEQTWQPQVGMISGVQMPYYTENHFSGDIVLRIYSDDYSEVLAEDVQNNFMFTAGESGSIEFAFDRTKVVKGERLRIQIFLQNVSGKGLLQIASGSNYGGCSVSGRDVGQAAALDITFAKSSRLFWFMSVLFPIAGCSLFMMVATGRKWEETVAVSIFSEGLILYLFGLVGHLLLGIGFIYAMALCAILVAIYLYNKKGMGLNDLLSPGLWIYMGFFCVILICSQSDWLGMRDDLRHWGIAVRDMFYYNSFALHADTTVILPRYLPFTTLIEYIFEYVNGMFNEGILLVAYQTMLLSTSIIFCKLIQGEKKRKLFLPVIAAMICIPVFFFNNISSTIMVDSLMAVIMAYILICYYSEKISWFNRIRIGSALCALALIKEIGLVLAGAAALIIFGDIFFQGIRKKRINIKELLFPIICVCLVLLMYFSWQIYLSMPVRSNAEEVMHREISNEADTIEEPVAKEPAAEEPIVEEPLEIERNKEPAIAASGITLEGIKNIFTGNGEWYQYQVTRNFITALLDGETYSIGSIKVSFTDLLVIVTFFFCSLAFFGYWSGGKDRRYIFSGMVLAAGACFCLFLQITYWFAFEMYEAMDLTSYDRYLAPYLCAIVMAVIYLIFEGSQYSAWESAKTLYLIYALTVIMIIVMPIEGLIFESNDLQENTTEENTYGYDNIAEILRSMADKGEKVQFICSNSDGYTGYIFRNAVCPIVSEYDNWNIVSNQELYDKQYELYSDEEINIHNTASIVSVEVLAEEFRKCKYVVIFHADELFKESYSELFKGTVIQDGSVYRVMNNAGSISLCLVGSTEIRGYH